MSDNGLKNLRKTKIVVADDHSRMRAGIISLLTSGETEAHFEVVGEARSGYEALVLCKQTKPDILILDLHLGADMSGFEVIHEIRRQKMPVKILVLTATSYARNAAAEEMGAEAYLLKSDSDAFLIQKLYELAQSESSSFQSFKNSKPTDPDIQVNSKKYALLTSHEIRLLQMAAAGMIQAQIAKELVLEKGSVAVAFTRIYEKLNVKNLPEAIAFVYRNKILE